MVRVEGILMRSLLRQIGAGVAMLALALTGVQPALAQAAQVSNNQQGGDQQGGFILKMNG